jgi:Ca2+-binding RTX toxin-like protein
MPRGASRCAVHGRRGPGPDRQQHPPDFRGVTEVRPPVSRGRRFGNAAAVTATAHAGDGNDTVPRARGPTPFYRRRPEMIPWSGASSNDSLYGGDGTNRLHGRSGQTTLRGRRGSCGDDEMQRQRRERLTRRRRRQRQVVREDGNERVHGWEGDDQLFGGAGNDVCSGTTGATPLRGAGRTSCPAGTARRTRVRGGRDRRLWAGGVSTS